MTKSARPFETDASAFSAAQTVLRRAAGWRGFCQRMTVSRRGSRLLVLTCLMVSIWVFSYSVKFEQLHAQFEFRKLTLSSVGGISLRIGNYAQALTGTAAHIGVKAQLDPVAMKKYVAGLALDENSPGILGVGFIRAVPTQDITVIERAEGPQRGPSITAKHENERAARLVLTDITPELGSAHFAGIEQGENDRLRAGLEAARTTNEPVVVRPYANANDLLMVHAVYHSQNAVQSGAYPPELFMGWAVVAFSAGNALDGVTAHFGIEYNLVVFPMTAQGPESPLFTSAKGVAQQGAFSQNYRINTYGNNWLLRFVSTPKFDAAYSSYSPYVLLTLGLLFTVLVRTALKSAALRHRALKSLAELRARQLGAREEENRALIETSVSVVMVLDDAGYITFANEGAAELFCMERRAFERRKFTDFVTSSHGACPANLCNAEGILGCGSKLALDVQSNTWRTAEGTVQTTVLIRDLTEQIKGRQAIEALHKRYEIALTGAGIGIFEIDTVQGTAEMSKAWHMMMGTQMLSGPLDLEQDFVAGVHGEDIKALRKAYQRCITGTLERCVVEYRFCVNGVWRWMHSDAVPVARSADGRATKMIGVQTDITELREARSALELSEARFRTVLEDAPVGMAVLNEVGTFIGVNAALARLSGYDVGALHNKMRLAELLLRKDFVTLSRGVRSLLKSGNRKTYQNQFRLRTKSGELRWGLFNLSWTYDSNLGENVYIAQVIDITDQKRVEQIKSEFVATVSHELRTPLTSIKGALALLDVTASRSLPDTAKRLLDIASVNANRLTALVNDILDLERISSGEVAFEFETVSLHDIIAHTLNEMLDTAAQHQNKLVLGPDDTTVQVYVDAGRVQQVIRNLVSNACKFSDEGTHVVVRADVRGDKVIVFVENTGPPVPESFKDQIFDAFTQADGSDTRSMGGTGLGLNIARQIVMRLGGRIGFERLDENRTVFWFTCPRANGIALDRAGEAERASG